MPHIHTLPDQHDMTVSGYILRLVEGEWRCLVHYHKKMDVLMQIGGHIELNETPWQAIMHELAEETGYQLSELSVLQFMATTLTSPNNIAHPVPFSMNTHSVGNEHFHSDICFGFIAESEPKASVAEGETNDLRWLSLADLRTGAQKSEILSDVAAAYEYVVNHIAQFVIVPAKEFSTQKPTQASVTYKRGAPGEQV